MGLLSKATIYGMRATAYVATHPAADRFVSIREIADQLGISFHFLTKILQQLTEGGLLVSSQGPRGGVMLARPASQVTVEDIVASIQGDDVFTSCILGLAGCGEETPCPRHARWVGERAKLRTMFEATKLADVARRVRGRKLRLADEAVTRRKERTK